MVFIPGISLYQTRKEGPARHLFLYGWSTGNHCLPVRFLEEGRLIVDAGRVAFGTSKRIVAVPEFRRLEVSGEHGRRVKKIGKVDFLLALLDEKNDATDFARSRFRQSTRPEIDSSCLHSVP